jgi:predicted enzyme related to lactoylglutathione lyase
MANSIVHFEIFASDVERARRFYERVFGWKFEVAGGPDFYLIVTGPDTDPGLKHGLRVTIAVTSITQSMSAVEAEGGKLRSSIVDIPHVGKVVEFADTEDNVACILQYVAGHELAAK